MKNKILGIPPIQSSENITKDTVEPNTTQNTEFGVRSAKSNLLSPVNSPGATSFGFKEFKPEGLHGALFEALGEKANEYDFDISEINIERDPEFSKETVKELFDKRRNFYNFIQGYVGYYKVAVEVNPAGKEQPYYDLQKKKIYLGPSDFIGDGNIVKGVGGMLHETLHVHLSKGVKEDFINFIFDKDKPGFPRLFNIVEDIRINDIASDILDHGSDYIKYSYKDIYDSAMSAKISETGKTEDEIIEEDVQGIGDMKVVAISSILHYYGILKIGDKSLNDTEYTLVQKRLSALEKAYPDDYKYVTEKLDALLDTYGHYGEIRYSVRSSFEGFVNGVYNDLYLPYKQEFEEEKKKQEEQQKRQQEMEDKMKDLLGDLMDEMGESVGEDGNKQGDPGGKGGDDSEEGSGDGEKTGKGGYGKGEPSDKDGGQESNSISGSSGQGEGGSGKSQGGGDEDGNNPFKGTGNRDKKIKGIVSKKGKSALDSIADEVKRLEGISKGIKDPSLSDITKKLDAEFNRDEYDRIRNSISFKIADFVTRFRKVLFEKKKTQTLKGLNSGSNITGGRLMNNYIENKIGTRDSSDMLKGVFERRRAPGKIPNYFFGIAIDKSGSMGDDKMNEAKKAGVLLVEVLRSLKIPVFLYSYNESYTNIYSFNKGSFDNARRIANIESSGGTNEVPVLTALEKDLDSIKVNPNERSNTNKIIFIITDGESFDATTVKIKQMKNKGYTVFGIGIGDGVREEAIKKVYGDNLGVYCPDVSKLSKILTEKISDLYGIR